MSLTNVLKSDMSVIRLFSTIPNLKGLFHTDGYHSEVFQERTIPIYPTVPNSNPQIVSIAYNLYLQAHLQRENKTLLDDDLSYFIRRGLNLLKSHKILSKTEFSLLYSDTMQRWERRIQFIEGDLTDVRTILKDCLHLSYYELYTKNRYKPDDFSIIDKSNFKDLLRLSYSTRDSHNLFSNLTNLILTPTFDSGSNLVGGANADLMINDTMLDVNISNTHYYNHKLIQKLIAYYVLSTYSKSNTIIEVKKLAIYYPRFKKMTIIKIDDIKKNLNIQEFSKLFFDILLTKKHFSKEELDPKKFKRIPIVTTNI